MPIPWSEFLLPAHAFFTFAMTGLIWFVQIVHYPMMERFPQSGFVTIEREHCDRTGFVVGPLMLGELATAILLWIDGLRAPAFSVSLALLALIWASTALLQMPLHRRLLRGKDPAAIHRLVATNWIRTIGWTARGGCLLALLV